MSIIREIDSLAQILEGDLPGKECQYIMSPTDGREYEEVRNDHRLAGVMALLYPDEESLKITYIRRAAANPNDKHAGQISFPGGKYEEGDGDLVSCALRETKEEIGVPSQKVEILGKLSELYVFASNFVVHPYVGFISEKPNFILQASEVAGIIHAPLPYLADKGIIKKDAIRVRNIVLHDVPYFDLFGDKLWGATAMITSELLELYRRSQEIEKWV